MGDTRTPMHILYVGRACLKQLFVHNPHAGYTGRQPPFQPQNFFERYRVILSMARAKITSETGKMGSIVIHTHASLVDLQPALHLLLGEPPVELPEEHLLRRPPVAPLHRVQGRRVLVESPRHLEYRIGRRGGGAGGSSCKAGAARDTLSFRGPEASSSGLSKACLAPKGIVVEKTLDSSKRSSKGSIMT